MFPMFSPVLPRSRFVASVMLHGSTVLALSACASGPIFDRVGPDYQSADALAPGQWQAPRPAQSATPQTATGQTRPATDAGRSAAYPLGVADQSSTAADPNRAATDQARVQEMVKAWARLGDPLLPSLILEAQRVSASLAQAASRIERARADLVAAGVRAEPALDAQGLAQRSASTMGMVIPGLVGPLSYRSQLTLGAQASWEIDLFGGLARQREFAQAQWQGSLWQWHDARVSVAAEVATVYASVRYCERQQNLAQADANSRQETARLVAAAGEAGFQSPATVALARASASDAAAVLKQRQAQCLLAIKALVALTGLSEPELIAQLREQSARLPAPSAPPVPAVPAQALARRPDIAAAERELAAASAAIGVAEAQRYPRLALSGQISPTVVRPAGFSTLSVVPWSIGPTISLPLTGDAARAANTDAARSAYQAAEVSYRARVRQAVREVEEALISLRSVQERRADVRAAALGYREALAGAQSRQRAGLGSLIELEDARRTSLAADAAETALDHEWLVAWINLYRALGGGWDGL